MKDGLGWVDRVFEGLFWIIVVCCALILCGLGLLSLGEAGLAVLDAIGGIM